MSPGSHLATYLDTTYFDYDMAGSPKLRAVATLYKPGENFFKVLYFDIDHPIDGIGYTTVVKIK